jgi:hypothetical protein
MGAFATRESMETDPGRSSMTSISSNELAAINQRVNTFESPTSTKRRSNSADSSSAPSPTDPSMEAAYEELKRNSLQKKMSRQDVKKLYVTPVALTPEQSKAEMVKKWDSFSSGSDLCVQTHSLIINNAGAGDLKKFLALNPNW